MYLSFKELHMMRRLVDRWKHLRSPSQSVHSPPSTLSLLPPSVCRACWVNTLAHLSLSCAALAAGQTEQAHHSPKRGHGHCRHGNEDKTAFEESCRSSSVMWTQRLPCLPSSARTSWIPSSDQSPFLTSPQGVWSKSH